jgi:hypothetical protein
MHELLGALIARDIQRHGMYLRVPIGQMRQFKHK